MALPEKIITNVRDCLCSAFKANNFIIRGGKPQKTVANEQKK